MKLTQEIINSHIKEGYSLSHFAKTIKSGLILEFGVASGGTIKQIAASTSLPVYGFDSFEGLPEDWFGRSGERFLVKGAFAGSTPIDLPNNVKLIKGLFQDTLEDFLNTHTGSITFVHIDSDLYSSAKYVLTTLKDRLENNSIICFDEIFKHNDGNEWRALDEFLEENNYDWKCIGSWGEQGAFRIIKDPGVNTSPTIINNPIILKENKEIRKILTKAKINSDIKTGYNLSDFVKRVKSGLILEFSVNTGDTIKQIAGSTLLPVYGFDSFKGLPEEWISDTGNIFLPIGSFASSPPTNLPNNVELVIGTYEETLDNFLDNHLEPVTFLHIDVALYSTTKYILDKLKNKFQNGSIIVFDEILRHGDSNEWRAFDEFLIENKYGYNCIGTWGEQAAFQISL